MKQQVTASLLAQKPAPILSSRVTELPPMPAITTSARTTAVAPLRPENVPFPPFIPAAAANPVIAPATPAANPLPAPKNEDTFLKGNAYLDQAIDSVSGSIRAGLQQAILTQQSFAAAEPQRDESILDNQGELGLKVSGKESFKVNHAALDTVVAAHPTGEQPMVVLEVKEVKEAPTLTEV